MSSYLKSLVVASLEEIEEVSDQGGLSDGVIEAVETALAEVSAAHDEAVASGSDVAKLEGIADALQETLVVAQESLVGGALSPYAQQFMTVSLRHAYRRIGLESDGTETDVGAVDDVTKNIDSETMSMESFGGNVKAFFAALLKALKESWEKVKVFFKATFLANGIILKALEASKKLLTQSKYKGTVKGSLLDAKEFDGIKVAFTDTLEALSKYAHLNLAYVGHDTDTSNEFNKIFFRSKVLMAQHTGDVTPTDYHVSDLIASVHSATDLISSVTHSASDIEKISKVIDAIKPNEDNVVDLEKYRAALKKQVAGMRVGQHNLHTAVNVGLMQAKALVRVSKEISKKKAA